MPRGIDRGRQRANDTAANEETEKAGEEFDKPQDETLPEETEQWFSAPGFARMRTDWKRGDRQNLDRVRVLVNDRLFEHFQDAYAIMSDLYDIVREPVVDPDTAEVQRDEDGWIIWRRSHSGAYIEDWAQLTTKQREDFLYRITTSLFAWEQRAAELWTEAMFAKAVWQEKYAMEFDAPVSGTVEDRVQRGNMKAAEERYFALMVTSLSRRADALVRTMSNLALRIRDTLQT